MKRRQCVTRQIHSEIPDVLLIGRRQALRPCYLEHSGIVGPLNGPVDQFLRIEGGEW